MPFHTQNQSVGPAHFQHVPWLLLGFIVISSMVHGSTFLFSTRPSVPLPEQRFGAPVISAILAPAKTRPATPPAHSAAPPPQTNIKKPEPSHHDATPRITRQSKMPAEEKTTQATTTIANQTIPVAPAAMMRALAEHATRETSENPATRDAPTTQESLTHQRTKQLEQQRNYLLGELQNRLKQYLTYPLRARKRGWQGEVMVAFYIDKGGRLNNVRLTKSSGYSVLDRSTLSAIGKLKPIDLPDSLGRLQAMEMKLPVSYQLHEG